MKIKSVANSTHWQEEKKILLNYSILDLLNKAERSGPFDLPALHCNTSTFPDYLALYNQPALYYKTPDTAVCFYTWDRDFDGKNGLFWAIYYHDEDRLAYFKNRFKGVKYVITPDYSMFGDIHYVENLIRIWKARIVALWFILELHAVVIPNISYMDIEHLPTFLGGLEDCSVIAMSTKGHIRYRSERRLFQAVIRYVVDNMPLKYIIVYSACGKDETCLEIFRYALEHGVQVIIPDNTLRTRNIVRRCA